MLSGEAHAFAIRHFPAGDHLGLDPGPVCTEDPEFQEGVIDKDRISLV